MTGSGTYQIKSWDEQPYHEEEGETKLCRAEITQAYEGTMAGESSLQYLMVYQSGGSAVFTGVERFSGSVDGVAGSFVIIHHGKYEGGTASSSWCIVSGSGTGELSGIKGSGSFLAEHGGTASYQCEYQLT
jgi:hypothetical protein